MYFLPCNVTISHPTVVPYLVIVQTVLDLGYLDNLDGLYPDFPFYDDALSVWIDPVRL